MAQGYLRKLLDNKAAVYSAGIEAHGLNQEAVSIMAEDGIDISHHTSNLASEYANISWDYIITVCDHARENCPYIPAGNARRLHRDFFDPSRVEGSEVVRHDAFQKARDEIRGYCEGFAANEFP